MELTNSPTGKIGVLDHLRVASPVLEGRGVRSIVATVVIIAAAGFAHGADYPGLVEDPTTPKARPLESAAENHLDVPYLDDARDTVTHGGWPDTTLAYRTRMNIYVPPGDGPFPCFVYLHGGGYGEGHATRFQMWNERAVDGRQVDPRQMGMQRGYVLVSMNYILKNPIIQVQRDFKEGMRFLRANAKRYHINPNRMAAIGASAGGWLITSGGLTTADDYGCRSQHRMPLSAWPAGEAWKWGIRDLRRKEPMMLISSFDEMEPRHPSISARLSALVFDFSHQLASTTPDDPLMLSVSGDPQATWRRYADVPQPDVLKQKLTLLDYGKHNPDQREHKTLHVPPISLLVPGADGKPITAAEHIYDWLDDALKGDAARTPAPEARPNRRIFKDKVAVTFATAAPGTPVRYTLDGTEPTTDSPLATAPLTLTERTTVKFTAVAKGMQPSSVATATFIKGDPPPRVTAPTEPTLPIATVGKSYELQFEAEGAKAWFFRLSCINGRWRDDEIKNAAPDPKAGHKALRDLQARTGGLYTIGLDCDLATGRLFGTPDRLGTYVLQVATARENNGPAECRTFTLVVQPR